LNIRPRSPNQQHQSAIPIVVKLNMYIFLYIYVLLRNYYSYWCQKRFFFTIRTSSRKSSSFYL